MKSFTSLAISLLALAGSTLAHPLSKRASASTFLFSIQQLSTDVKTYTSNINNTAASFSTLSTPDQAGALTSIGTSASSINDLITSYTASIPSIEADGDGDDGATSADAATDKQELAGALALLLGEINSSLNYAEAQTGELFVITKRQIAIIPLGTSLSALLAALDGVVDDLLALVKEIVDGLLLGLSGALVGITL